jgi:hypothetical protein
MRNSSYLLRWLLLLPAVAVSYLLAWGIPTVIGIPFLEGEIIADSPGTYDVFSHFLWDWIVHPLAAAFIGGMVVEASIKTGQYIAPSHKPETAFILSGMLVLLALMNIIMTLSGPHQAASVLVQAILYNISLGACAVYFAFSRVSYKQHQLDQVP